MTPLCCKSIALIIPLLLAGCQTTPNLGEHGIVEVFAVPANRSQLNENQAVDERLEVYEQEIREGRLVNVECAIPDASAYGGRRDWRRLAIISSKWTVPPNTLISISRQLGVDDYLSRQVFVFNAVVKATPEMAYFPNPKRKGDAPPRDILCQFDANGVPKYVAAGFSVQTWNLEFSKAERARHRQFSDDDFANGKVGIGFCSLRDISGETYYQPNWLFRVPAGLSVQKGDVIEIEFGEAESGGGKGVISKMIRRLGKRADFPNDGHAAVFCR